MTDRSWLKNDPNRVAGGRPFEESFFATVAFLMAFADVERLMMECTHSPVPLTTTSVRPPVKSGFSDIEEFDRGERIAEADPPPSSQRVSGTLRAG